MRHVILMRHAEAAWPQGGEDIKRPLASGGRKEAKAIGLYMQRQEISADFALVSSALRTCETWEIISPYMGSPHWQLEPQLYSASSSGMMELIRALPDALEKVIVLGHNPVIHMFALKLLKGAGQQDMNGMNKGFPTAAFASVQFDSLSWQELTWNSGYLECFIKPDDIL